MAKTSSNQVLRTIVFLLLLLLAISILLTNLRVEKNISSATPEGVVQKYLTALLEGKNDRAAAFYVLESNCDASDIDRTFFDKSLRAVLEESSIEGDVAYVKVNLTSDSSGIFQNGLIDERTFRLKLQKNKWRIDGIPWPLWECDGQVK